MKVLLVNPNYLNVYRYVNEESTMILPPLGLAYIAAVLRDKNIAVKILDLAAYNMDDAHAREAMKREKPDIVGITAATNTIEEAYRIAGIAKSLGAMVVIGGPHTSALPEKTLKECRETDIVIRGEGEYAMLELAQGKPLKLIRGLSYRVGNTIKKNPDRPPIKDLNSLPLPARDLLPLERYRSIGVRKYPFATIMTSRGCPFSCTFCTNYMVHGKGFRPRSPENVLKEIDMLVNKYGVKEINILDDNFTLIPGRAEKICDMLMERGYDLIWKCGNGIRADMVTQDLLVKMKRAGCYLLAFGVESGNPDVMKNIQKGETLDQIRKAVLWTKKAGIMTEGFFMLGNEGDTEKTMNETIEFAKELDLDIAQFQVFIPIPGSAYTKKIEKNGRIFAKSWSDYNAFNEPIFSCGPLTPELMSRMQKKAYREYYFRPRMMVKKLLEIRSLSQLRDYMNAALGILKLK